MPKLTHAVYLAIIAILGAAVIWLFREVNLSTDQNAEAGSAISSIAILPFATRGSEDTLVHIADTVRSDLITALSNRSSIRVASRGDSGSFANTTLSIREIGDRLGVSTIMEGAVVLRQNRVRIIVQLIDAETDEHLWSKSYDRDVGDVDSVAADVERSVSMLVQP